MNYISTQRHCSNPFSILIILHVLLARCSDVSSRTIESQSSLLSITLVNDVTFHYEVLLGYLHLFLRFNCDIQLVLPACAINERSPWRPSANSCDSGLIDIIHSMDRHGTRLQMVGANSMDTSQPADLAVFISPSYSPNTSAIFTRLKPRSTIFILHSVVSDAVLAALADSYPQVHLVALAPHVAANMPVERRVAWMLPIFPVNCSSVCSGPEQNSSFVVQGQMEAHRRNYTGK
jgi:hypothetical protein